MLRKLSNEVCSIKHFLNVINHYGLKNTPKLPTIIDNNIEKSTCVEPLLLIKENIEI